jgi:hypothetical protein
MKFGIKGSMPLILPNPPITALLFPNFAAETEQMHEHTMEEFRGI